MPRHFYQMLAFLMRSNKVCVKDIYIHDKFDWYCARMATSKACNKDERIGSKGKIVITKTLSLSYENKSTKYINPNRKNQLQSSLQSSSSQMQLTGFCTYETDTIKLGSRKYLLLNGLAINLRHHNIVRCPFLLLVVEQLLCLGVWLAHCAKLSVQTATIDSGHSEVGSSHAVSRNKSRDYEQDTARGNTRSTNVLCKPSLTQWTQKRACKEHKANPHMPKLGKVSNPNLSPNQVCSPGVVRSLSTVGIQ